MISNNVYQPSFLSRVSHELRLALTGITGMVHFLNETPLNHQQKEYLQVILSSANRILDLEKKLYADVKKN